MTDEELWEICETPGAREGFELENNLFEALPWYAEGLCVKGREAKYAHWSNLEYWTLKEATCLSIGFEPIVMPVRNVDFPPPDNILEFYWNRQEQISRALFFSDKNQDRVAPSAFVKWALAKSVEIPTKLAAILEFDNSKARPTMLDTADRRTYESALKVILGLRSTQFGYQSGGITKDMNSEIKRGLEKLGLSLDRKTIIKLLNDAISNRKGFVEKQEQRDDKKG